MWKRFKQRVKILLQEKGLLPLVLTILRWCNFKHVINYWINYFVQFLRALKFYIYNNLLTHVPNHVLRLLYLKYVLRVNIGQSCFIHMGCRFEGNISIGNNSVVGRCCVLLGDITIRNNVSITAETYIFTSTHIADSVTFEASYNPVVIEDYAWIGARAMILPGVVIGRGAILGAASTATKSIPEYSIFAGTPAKEVGRRSKSINYTLIYSPFFQ
jgi:acetyltransferase-like isoleucine patch superfamily enzyme